MAVQTFEVVTEIHMPDRDNPGLTVPAVPGDTVHFDLDDADQAGDADWLLSVGAIADPAVLAAKRDAEAKALAKQQAALAAAAEAAAAEAAGEDVEQPEPAADVDDPAPDDPAEAAAALRAAKPRVALGDKPAG